MNKISFTITSVEKETGLSKDILRMWERRYGFPSPGRDAAGNRLYPADQVERLRLIKRLIDQGHRPGRLMAMSPEALQELPVRHLQGATAHDAATDDAREIGDCLALIKDHDAAAFQQSLQQNLVRQGLGRFVMDTVAPLTRRVGEAWEDGRFAVFEEHLFTELTKRVLRQAIASLPTATSRPRILLTSVPDEPHVLGLLMVEALFALEGAQCVPLGPQMPLLDIAQGAAAHRADIVALSFSSAFPARRIPPALFQLRELLPADVALWAGGEGMQHVAPPDGVTRLLSLKDGLSALGLWTTGDSSAKKSPAQTGRAT